MASILMSDVLEHQLLPVDAQDVVTRVRLVIAGNRAGAEADGPTIKQVQGQWSPPPFAAYTYLSYFPAPIVFEYTAPEHSVYGATRALALPSGVNPFLLPNDPRIPEPVALNFDNPGSPSVIRDGDPLTSADFSGGLGDTAWVTYLPDPAVDYVGFRLRYALSTTGVTMQRGVSVGMYYTVRAQPPLDDSDWFEGDSYVNELPDTENAELYAVFPPDARWLPANEPFPLERKEMRVQLHVPAGTEVNSMQVTDFYPLVLNEALLEEIARAQIRLPAQAPRRVTVRGALPPTDTSHTIVGWPGGDYTGRVARQTYREGVTVVDFEQAGAPPGVPQELLEAERVRTTRTQAAIANANYNLMLGSRR